MNNNTTSSLFSGLSRRKTAKQLAYRSRYQALSSHDQVQARKIRKYLMYCLALGQSDPMMLDLSEIFCFKYFAMMYECTSDIERISRPIRKVVSIDMFSASSCYTNFKFRKSDLHTILDLFEFPDYCKLHNNGSMRGEEVFCRGLYELCSGMNQQVMCENVFGREQSQQSFAFKYFINHIFFNFGKLLKQEGFAWWHRNGFLKTSAHAV